MVDHEPGFPQESCDSTGRSPVGDQNRLLGGRLFGRRFLSAFLGAFLGIVAFASINSLGFRSGLFDRCLGGLATTSGEKERSKGSRESKLRLHCVVTPKCWYGSVESNNLASLSGDLRREAKFIGFFG